MGVVRIRRSKGVPEKEEELRHLLISCAVPAVVHRRKDDEGFGGFGRKGKGYLDENCGEERLVCVTSGISFLGIALVNRLLSRGYNVRITVDNQEDIEKVKAMESCGELRKGSNVKFSAVMVKLTQMRSLLEAFEGCCGVFHTMSFTDPAGLSGYSKAMAEIEVKACESVMEACAETASVKYCVLTSSLLACISRQPHAARPDLSPIVNHKCWSDESVCISNKLWYALGKLRAEKAAWRIAEERGLKLTTICPGLVTGPEFWHRNATATIAYLKGAKEMHENGLLATVDVFGLAEAHLQVFEAMGKTAFGRYICFDHVINSNTEASKFADEVGIPAEKICATSEEFTLTRFQLSNKKLTNLMTKSLRPCYNES